MYEKKRLLGDVNLDQDFPMGLFENHQLLAIASFIFESDTIADVGIITHPQHRGKGFSKVVVIELVRYGLQLKRIVQYTTQVQNKTSLLKG